VAYPINSDEAISEYNEINMRQICSEINFI